MLFHASVEPAHVMSGNLEHLPLGLAILDRELHLCAYNSIWANWLTIASDTRHDLQPGVALADIAPRLASAIGANLDRLCAGETVRLAPGEMGEASTQRPAWESHFAPVIQQGEVTGVMHLLTDVTPWVEQVREQARELDERRKVAEGLHNILAALNSIRPLDEMLDLVIMQAGRLLGTEVGAIYRLDPTARVLRTRVVRGQSLSYLTPLAIPVGQGAVGRAIQERRPIVVPDVAAVAANDEQGIDPLWHVHLAHGYRSILAAPLMSKNEVYGGLALYYPGPRAFMDDEIELVTTFADQAMLAIENARLRTQVEQAAAAAERNRLARELHDAVTQTLFSASLIADVLPRLWERNMDEGRRRLVELRQLTRGALAEMRSLLLELRPAALTEVELRDLLRQFAEATMGRSRMPVELHVEGQRDLPPDVQVALYRIAQEALNNVVKHANASQAWVRLVYTADGVDLSIRDNGRGFNPGRLSPVHLGLDIMRERAEAIHARLTIDSEPDQGTHVLVSWSAA